MKSFRLIALSLLILTLHFEGFSQENIKTIFLVRHAEKADDGTSNPSLDEKGVMRAETLAKMLSSAEVTHIYSTNYKRTLETGQPLAKALGIEISTYDPRDPLAIQKISEESGTTTILVIGHSNTIPTMVNQLIGVDKYEQLGENDYDNLFTVTVAGDNKDCFILKY